MPISGSVRMEYSFSTENEKKINTFRDLCIVRSADYMREKKKFTKMTFIHCGLGCVRCATGLKSIGRFGNE